MALTQVQGGMLAGSTNTTTTIQSNGTTAITIDSSQNVGIGVATPTGKLAIDATNSNTPRIVFKNPSANGDGAISTFVSSTGTDVILGSNAYINSSGNFARFDSAQAGSYVYANRTGLLLFGTNTSSGVATERMRITSGGDVQIGTTNITNGGFSFEAGYNGAGKSAALFGHITGTGSGNQYCIFYYDGTIIGSITQNGTTAVAYNTSSDYRLKENIAPMTGALATVAQLKPITYKWKSDGSNGQGFIAHELQEVVPDCVTGEKDAMRTEKYEITPSIPATYDEEGNELTPAVEAVMGEREVPDYQGVDTSFLVATLTAAIQELKAELDATKAEVAALKAAP